MMNIYQMYHSNSNKFGFFVQRDSWVTVIAEIISIEGVKEGESISGKPPYFGNPKVKAKFYKVSEWDYDFIESFIEETDLSCPGTYSYSKLKI